MRQSNIIKKSVIAHKDYINTREQPVDWTNPKEVCCTHRNRLAFGIWYQWTCVLWLSICRFPCVSNWFWKNFKIV